MDSGSNRKRLESVVHEPLKVAKECSTRFNQTIEHATPGKFLDVMLHTHVQHAL